MSLDAFFKDPKQIYRLIVTALYIAGGSIASYYQVSFRVDKFGLYYKDADQMGLAIGVGILIFAWFLRNWKKI